MRIRAIALHLLAVIAFLAVIETMGVAPSEASTATPWCSTTNLLLGFGDRVSPQTGENGVMYTLMNREKSACLLRGYPGISFYDSKGHLLPFKYTWSGTQYVTHASPSVVVLRPGSRAYFLVAKYRCDIGNAMGAATIHVYPPNTKQQLIGRASPSGAATFAYCKGGTKDPGQLVEVSPVEASSRATLPGAPTILVTPSINLRDGEQIVVQVRGGDPGGKFFVSECATAADANINGCGDQLAAQPFGVTDESGTGSITFHVHATAATKPYNTTAYRPCKDQCVLMATGGLKGTFVYAQLKFSPR